jgi:replicative DNA helicase
MQTEQIFIGACLANPELIDSAISGGLSNSAFTDTKHLSLWQSLVALRSKGQLTDTSSVYMAMGDQCPAAELFEAEKSCNSSITGKKALKKLIWEGQLAVLKPALQDAIACISRGGKAEEVAKAVEGLQGLLKPTESEAPSLEQLIGEVKLWAEQEIAGTRDNKDVVTTGLPTFDSLCQPIEAHEYVVVGARTSIGKSSFMSQIASHNLNRGLRVAYFTLETSANAVVKQIAGQRSRVNLRNLNREFADKQADYFKELKRLSTQQLRVFDKDMSITQIENRCRLLAASWKPQLVILDYLGLIRGTDGSAYERMGQLSKAMIPLRKTVGCALIVAAQLNRGNEREDRAPSRTDFRDAGSIEEDAHRIIALHRPSKSHSGSPQELGQSTYDYELLQLKLRDGPLAFSRIKYFANHTWFYEQAD